MLNKKSIYAAAFLLMISNVTHCAEQQVSRWYQLAQNVAESKFKHVPTLVAGGIGAFGLNNLLAQGISSSNWYTTALPAALLAAAPVWANYVQSLQREKERPSHWRLFSDTKTAFSSLAYGAPIAGTALFALLNAYRHNQLLNGLLVGSVLSAPALWHAKRQIGQESIEDLEQAKNIFNDLLSGKNMNALELKKAKWAVDVLNLPENTAKKAEFIERTNSLTVGQTDNVLKALHLVGGPALRQLLESIKDQDAYEFKTTDAAYNEFIKLLDSSDSIEDLQEKQYKKIENSLKILSLSPDNRFAERFTSLFRNESRHTKMNNLLSKIQQRDILYQKVGYDSEGALQSLINFMQKAQEQANAPLNDFTRNDIDLAIESMLVFRNRASKSPIEFVAYMYNLNVALKNRLKQIQDGPQNESLDDKNIRLQRLGEELDQLVERYESESTGWNDFRLERVKALRDLYKAQQNPIEEISEIKAPGSLSEPSGSVAKSEHKPFTNVKSLVPTQRSDPKGKEEGERSLGLAQLVPTELDNQLEELHAELERLKQKEAEWGLVDYREKSEHAHRRIAIEKEISSLNDKWFLSQEQRFPGESNDHRALRLRILEVNIDKAIDQLKQMDIAKNDPRIKKLVHLRALHANTKKVNRT